MNPIFERRRIDPSPQTQSSRAVAADLSVVAQEAAAAQGDIFAEAAVEAREAGLARAAARIQEAQGGIVGGISKPSSNAAGYIAKRAEYDALVAANNSAVVVDLDNLYRQAKLRAQDDRSQEWKENAQKFFDNGSEGVLMRLTDPANKAAFAQSRSEFANRLNLDIQEEATKRGLQSVREEYRQTYQKAMDGEVDVHNAKHTLGSLMTARANTEVGSADYTRLSTAINNGRKALAADVANYTRTAINSGQNAPEVAKRILAQLKLPDGSFLLPEEDVRNSILRNGALDSVFGTLEKKRAQRYALNNDGDPRTAPPEEETQLLNTLASGGAAEMFKEQRQWWTDGGGDPMVFDSTVAKKWSGILQEERAALKASDDYSKAQKAKDKKDRQRVVGEAMARATGPGSLLPRFNEKDTQYFADAAAQDDSEDALALVMLSRRDGSGAPVHSVAAYENTIGMDDAGKEKWRMNYAKAQIDAFNFGSFKPSEKLKDAAVAVMVERWKEIDERGEWEVNLDPNYAPYAADTGGERNLQNFATSKNPEDALAAVAAFNGMRNADGVSLNGIRDDLPFMTEEVQRAAVSALGRLGQTAFDRGAAIYGVGELPIMRADYNAERADLVMTGQTNPNRRDEMAYPLALATRKIDELNLTPAQDERKINRIVKGYGERSGRFFVKGGQFQQQEGVWNEWREEDDRLDEHEVRKELALLPVYETRDGKQVMLDDKQPITRRANMLLKTGAVVGQKLEIVPHPKYPDGVVVVGLFWKSADDGSGENPSRVPLVIDGVQARKLVPVGSALPSELEE